MATSKYLRNKVLNHILASATYTPPATVYAALFITVFEGDELVLTECSGGSYARQSVPFGTTTTGISASTAVQLFSNMPEVTIEGLWLMDAVTGGNFLIGGNLTAPRTVASGDTLRLNSGELTATMD